MMQHRVVESQEGVILEPQQPVHGSVIWLHGLGADGHDFVPIVPEIKASVASSLRFVFPHAPVRPVTLNGGMPMRAWFDLTGLDRNAAQDEAGIRASERALRKLVERELQGGLTAGTVVLAGFSQGGAIALHTALRYEARLAGVLALSTYLPLASRLAQEASAANRDVPILMCHGRFDPVLGLELGQRSRDHLVSLGYPVDWREYPMQHEVRLEEIDDVSAWLAARFT